MECNIYQLPGQQEYNVIWEGREYVFYHSYTLASVNSLKIILHKEIGKSNKERLEGRVTLREEYKIYEQIYRIDTDKKEIILESEKIYEYEK